MARSHRRRAVSLTALALAGGTTLATIASAGPVGATTASAPAYYQGVTSGNVLGLALHLPSALPALPNLPNPLAIDLIGVTGNVTHNTLGTGPAEASRATAALADGSLVKGPLAPLGLDKVVEATLANPTPAGITQIPLHADPLAMLDVGALTAAVTKSTAANTSHAVLTDGTVAKLGQLLSTTGLNAVTDQLKQVDLTGQLQNTLNQLTSALQPVVQNDPTGVAAQLQSTVQGLVTKVNNIVANLQDTAVLSVNTLDATQAIGPAGDAAKSAAAVNLTKLNVLNGLLTVEGFVSKATAIADGRPGGASASFEGKTPIVAVGTPLLTATLDDTGLSLSNVTGLPQSVTDQVNSALAQLQAQLNTLLNTLGVSMRFIPGHTDRVAADGSYAAATGPEYDIAVQNIVTGEPVLEAALGHNTTASIAASQKQATGVVTQPRPPALPHTGANLPLIGGAGLALLIGAAVLRRRFNA